MFTGLVQAVGTVHALKPIGTGLWLGIDAGGWRHRPALGDSIAVDGCCLTLAEPMRKGSRQMVFHAVRETLSKTTLGGFEPGDKVNLEHAARADTLLGGHIVQGHIDGVGRVTRVHTGDDWRVWIALPPRGKSSSVSDADLAEYLVPKGSVCVSGVSLTVADVWKKGKDRGFTVALIPTTLDKTNLAALAPGDQVNLEMDVMAKTIVGWLKVYAGKANHRDTKTRSRTKKRK